ncbi:MAG: hypothetical protein V3573_08200 [Desulfovibrionaceae bacterium]
MSPPNDLGICRVYEAEVPQRPQWKFSVMVKDREEAQLREEIGRGLKVFSLGKVLLETRDQAIARRMADVVYRPRGS